MNCKEVTCAEVEKIAPFSKLLNISEPLAKLLLSRGIDSFDKAKHYFNPSLENLHNPFLMSGMDSAVERLSIAKEHQEKLMIFGDYDVDGTTSVATLYLFLKNYFSSITPFFPNRFTDGYGLSTSGIDLAVEQGITLMIVIDCGILSIDKVAYAKEKGVEIIICDHHLPGEKLPSAEAILNPKRKDCTYPFEELCGCGIGFKLIQGLALKWEIPFDKLIPLLDLVAIGTAADIVPLTDENRIICHFGLQQINKRERLFLKIWLSKLTQPTKISDIVFKIAPRINAAGRMKSATEVFDLLISNEEKESEQKAEQIEAYNRDRKEKDSNTTEAALEQIKQKEKEYSTVVYHENWHQGVLGIVASRLIETYYRPTVVLTRNENSAVGSVRSVREFNVMEVLKKCSQYLEHFGGHKYAAGLSLNLENLQQFEDCFEEEVKKCILPSQREPVFFYDNEIDMTSISENFCNILYRMAPFGPQNPTPVFKTSCAIDSNQIRIIGKEKNHLRFTFPTPQGTISGIAFGKKEFYQGICEGKKVNLYYTLEKNYFNNTISNQLMIRHIEWVD